MANTTYSTVSADASTYIEQKTLMIAERQTVFKQFGTPSILPQHNSKTIQFSRYARLALPLQPIAEGVDPTPQALAVETVTATLDEWAATVTLTDVAELTIKHPLLQKAIDLMGRQAGELLDREIMNVLIGGTNVIFPGNVTARGNLSAADKLTKNTIRKVIKTFKQNGAPRFDGKNYIWVVDPAVEADILDSIEPVIQYKDLEPIYNEEIGKFGGARFVTSNFIPDISLLADATYADSSSSGSLSPNTSYYFKTEAVDVNTGMVEKVSAQHTHTTGVGKTAIDVTFNADSSYVYNLYGSTTNGGPWYQIVAFQAAGSTYTVTSIPTSGLQPQATPPAGVTVHISYIFGKDAFGVVDLEGMNNFKVMITPANEVSDSNPIGLRRKISWKAMFKAVILNQNFMARVESASSY